MDRMEKIREVNDKFACFNRTCCDGFLRQALERMVAYDLTFVDLEDDPRENFLEEVTQ